MRINHLPFQHLMLETRAARDDPKTRLFFRCPQMEEPAVNYRLHRIHPGSIDIFGLFIFQLQWKFGKMLYRPTAREIAQNKRRHRENIYGI